MFGRRFKPSLWGTMAAIAGVCAGVLLGQWQLNRAQQKVELAQKLARRANEPVIHIGPVPTNADALEFRAIEARGTFEPSGMVLLDNRVRDGMVGYEVVMPLRIAGSDMNILVNRGWIAGNRNRSKLPEIRTPAGEISLSGIAVVPGQKKFELSGETIEGVVWQNLTIERYRAHMPFRIQPVLLQQVSETDDGLLRQWTMSQREVNVHRSYALQWFSLSVAIAVMYVFLSFRRDSDNN